MEIGVHLNYLLQALEIDWEEIGANLRATGKQRINYLIN